MLRKKHTTARGRLWKDQLYVPEGADQLVARRGSSGARNLQTNNAQKRELLRDNVGVGTTEVYPQAIRWRQRTLKVPPEANDRVLT